MTDDLLTPVAEKGPNKRGYFSYVPGPFDYGQLGDKLADEVRASTARINASKKTHIIEVGRELTAMKAKLEHGLFSEWIDRELNFSAATSRNYMAVARELAHAPLTVSVLPPAVLYRLAGSSPSVRDEIVSRIEGGEYVDRDEVVEAIRRPKQETAEAKKAAADEAKKAAKARLRRERRQQNWQAQWDAEVEEQRRQQSVCATELMERLLDHFELDAIAELNRLWRTANFNTIDQAIAARRREGGAA